MERREKRALAFLLAASLLCLALVGLAAVWCISLLFRNTDVADERA